MRPTDTVTVASGWTQLFGGISLSGLATTRSLQHNVIANNVIMGSGLAGDRDGIRVNDSFTPQTSADVAITGNVISNRNLATNRYGIVVKGLERFVIANNVLDTIENQEALWIGGSAQPTLDGTIRGNVIYLARGAFANLMLTAGVANANDVIITDNVFLGSNTARNVAIAEQAHASGVLVGRNQYGHFSGSKFSFASAGTRLVDLSQRFTLANLPTNLDDGSVVFCTDCYPRAVCAAGGTGATATRQIGAWTCGS
jgi:hypothetical protein